MADKTITALTAGAGLDGPELFEMVQAGASRKTLLQPIETVTSGAAPVDLDPSYRIHKIITGGTAGTEVVNLPNIPFDVAGDAELARIGERHIVYVETYTDPGDVVSVTINDGETIGALGINGVLSATTDAVVLDYEEAEAVLIWGAYGWTWDNSDANNSAETSDVRQLIPPMGSDIPPNSRVGLGASGGFGDAYSAAFQTWPIPGTFSNRTSGASPISIPPVGYTNYITTGGTGGAEVVTLQGAGGFAIGSRVTLVVQTLTDPADTVSIDTANIFTFQGAPVTTLIFDTALTYVVLESDGVANWRIYYNEGALVDGVEDAGGAPEFLSASGTYDPASLLTLTGATTTLAVAGAALGDYVTASFSLDLAGVLLTAWVSAADTVSARFFNLAGITVDLGSGTLSVQVQKKG